jgi:ParB/RepB/Spo0J family partition protein
MAQETIQVRLTKEIDVKPELIKRSRYQTRMDMFEDPEEIEKLAENIKKNGLLNRPLVRMDPNEKDKFEILGGHRRTNAIVNILKWETVPCRLVEGLEELEVFKLVLSENLQTNTLTDYEEGKAFQILRDEFGLSIGQIAENTDRSPPLVKKRIELADEIDRGREAYNAPDYYRYVTRVSQPIREQINKLFDLGNLDYVRDFIKKVIDGATVEELKVFVQACEQASRSGKKDVNAEIIHVVEEEKRKKRADVVQSAYKWYETVSKKIPKELKPEFEKGKTHLEWLVAENYEAKELKETLDKNIGKKKISCPKCHLDFNISQASERNKTVLLLKPKDKKFEKKTIAVQLVSSS